MPSWPPSACRGRRCGACKGRSPSSGWPGETQLGFPPTSLGRTRTRRWTWYLTDPFYRELLEEALHYARTGNWPRLVGHLKTLGHLPIFGGVFRQITDIRRRVQKLWGDTHLRSPYGQWKAPPWKKVLEDWPRRPLAASVYLYVDPKVDGDRPTTLGEWWEARR